MKRRGGWHVKKFVQWNTSIKKFSNFSMDFHPFFCFVAKFKNFQNQIFFFLLLLSSLLNFQHQPRICFLSCKRLKRYVLQSTLYWVKAQPKHKCWKIFMVPDNSLFQVNVNYQQFNNREQQRCVLIK